MRFTNPLECCVLLFTVSMVTKYSVAILDPGICGQNDTWISYCHDKYIYPVADHAYDFTRAQASCESHNSTLPIVRNAIDIQYLTNVEHYEGWIGLYKDLGSGKDPTVGWKWVDGTPYDPALTNWEVGNPTGSWGCVYRTDNGKWKDDYNCADNRRYTCECTAADLNSTCEMVTTIKSLTSKPSSPISTTTLKGTTSTVEVTTQAATPVTFLGININIWIIVGASIGGAVIFISICICVICCNRKQINQKDSLPGIEEQPSASETSNTESKGADIMEEDGDDKEEEDEEEEEGRAKMGIQVLPFEEPMQPEGLKQMTPSAEDAVIKDGMVDSSYAAPEEVDAGLVVDSENAVT